MKTKVEDFTKITQKNRKYYTLRVVMKRFDRDEQGEMDSIAQKLGGLEGGSGYSFLTGERDVSYLFPTKSKTQQFATKAFKAGIIRARVHLSEASLDWSYNEGDYVSYDKVMPRK